MCVHSLLCMNMTKIHNFRVLIYDCEENGKAVSIHRLVYNDKLVS